MEIVISNEVLIFSLAIGMLIIIYIIKLINGDLNLKDLKYKKP
jgi:hypothetical protein